MDKGKVSILPPATKGHWGEDGALLPAVRPHKSLEQNGPPVLAWGPHNVGKNVLKVLLEWLCYSDMLALLCKR